jgi:hypothetical protein
VNVPLRYIVELRPPRKGERFIVELNKTLTLGATRDFYPGEERWVIVDPVPADPTEMIDAATEWCRKHVLAKECCPEHIRLLQAVAAYWRTDDSATVDSAALVEPVALSERWNEVSYALKRPGAIWPPPAGEHQRHLGPESVNPRAEAHPK